MNNEYQSDTSSRAAADKRQAEIDKKKAEFLAKGGEIEVVETVVRTAADCVLSDASRRKRDFTRNLLSEEEKSSIDSPA